MIQPKVKAGFDISTSSPVRLKYTALDLTDYGTGIGGVKACIRTLELFRTDTNEVLATQVLSKSQYSINASLPNVFNLPIMARLHIVDEVGSEYVAEDSIAGFESDLSAIDSQYILFSANGFSTGRVNSTVDAAKYLIGDNIQYPIKGREEFMPENIDRYVLVRRASTLQGATIEDSKIIHCKQFTGKEELVFDYFNEFGVYYQYFCISRLTNQILFKSTSSSVAPSEIPDHLFEYGIYIGPEGGNPLENEDLAPDLSVIVPFNPSQPIDGFSISTLADRFEFYAKNHLDLRHNPDSKKDTAFLHFDMETLPAANRSGLKFPCLLLQTPDVDKDGDNDQVYEGYECSFMIIKPVPPGNYRAKAEAIDICKRICDEIYNRITRDANEGLFAGFQPKTSEGLIGPMTDNCYGWVITFRIEQGYDGEVHAEKWEDL